MSDYREECIRRKSVQAGILEQRPAGAKKKVGAKPFLLENLVFNQWGWAGRYATLKTADQAFEQQCRKHPRWEWRLLHDGKSIRHYEPTAAARL